MRTSGLRTQQQCTAAAVAAAAAAEAVPVQDLSPACIVQPISYTSRISRSLARASERELLLLPFSLFRARINEELAKSNFDFSCIWDSA